MSWLYLVRHGQAGTRLDYDRLSELGVDQARRLGKHLHAQKIEFTRLIAGALERQVETARIVETIFRAGQMAVPPLEIDPAWNEFDLGAVYRELAPQLAEDDAEFREQQAEMELVIEDPAHPVHRKWTRGDMAVIRAWMDGRYAVKTTESWVEFQGRIGGAFERLINQSGRGQVLLFTSATPVGIAMSRVLGLEPRDAMRLAGSLLNSSISTVRHRPDDLTMFNFNTVGHLPDPRQHTFR
ncbi:MAG: histidine phosphatase family protein [Bryobacteraceae bacterium]|nr:histidine phosphatase family protein [Bryobacteraceae bacterium]